MAQLFDPLRISTLALDSRLVQSGTWETMAEHDGTLTDRLVAIDEALAESWAAIRCTSPIRHETEGVTAKTHELRFG